MDEEPGILVEDRDEPIDPIVVEELEGAKKTLATITVHSILDAWEHTAGLILALLSIWLVHWVLEKLFGANERFFDYLPIKYKEVCSKSKARRTVQVKEAIIMLGREHGLRNSELAEALEIDPSAVTRRTNAARSRDAESPEMTKLREVLRANGCS